MQTYMLKENVEARCERKVQRVHQKHLTSKEHLLRGGVARGCGRILKDRKKFTKEF
jgi:hypothetical protein